MSYQEKCQYLFEKLYRYFQNIFVTGVACYDEYLIVQTDDTYYKVNYVMSEDGVQFDNYEQWEAVQKQWVSEQPNEIRSFKNAKGIYVKRETDKNITVAGYGVVFDSVDLHGERFTKDTNFFLDTFTKHLVLYDHRIGNIKDTIGFTKAVEADDYGLWIEAEIDKHNKYMSHVNGLLEKGILGWSSGTAPHLVDVENGEIKSWPIIEFSLTPTPAEPKTLGIQEYKTLRQAFNNYSQSLEKLDSLKNDGDNDKDKSVTNTNTGNKSKMNEEQIRALIEEQMSQLRESLTATPVTEDSHDDLSNTVNEAVQKSMGSFNEQINKLLKMAENSTVGYVTNEGGAKDKHVKSFADFLVAVKRKDYQRLSQVYKATKDMGDDTGEVGAYLLPSEYRAELLQLAVENSPLLQRVQRVDVSNISGRYPVLNQFLAPTAGTGDTAMAGGLTAAKAGSGSSGGSLTETNPKFEALDWRLHKVGGYVEVDNELIDDSPFAIEQLLRSLFSVAIASKKEYYVIRGTGNGEPLGILNSNALVNVTPATDNLFSWTDAITMYSRFKRAGGQPAWVVHPSIWPDLLNMEIGTAGSGAFVANMQTQNTMVPLMNFDIVNSEHSPQANNAGAVLLADLNAYLLFERSGLEIAFSEHARFTQDQGTWRFLERLDGKPWVTAPVTLSDPQGSYTVSPFVVHND